MKQLLTILLLGVLFHSGNLFAQEQSVLIFIRHAEKDSVGTDPGLSEKGVARAQHIAKLLQEQPLGAVFTTPFNRTRETGKIIAESQGLTVTEYNPFKTDVISSWREEYKGKTVLIVGHSNTVPAYINLLLGEERYKKLSEDEYDLMFITTVPEAGTPTVVLINTSPETETTNQLN